MGLCRFDFRFIGPLALEPQPENREGLYHQPAD